MMGFICTKLMLILLFDYGEQLGIEYVNILQCNQLALHITNQLDRIDAFVMNMYNKETNEFVTLMLDYDYC